MEDHDKYKLRQWEEALLYNAFSQWVNQYPEWSLNIGPSWPGKINPNQTNACVFTL